MTDDNFLISSYTTDQAIEDGILIDASGFIPVYAHKFKFGRLVITPGVYEIIEDKNKDGQVKEEREGGSVTYQCYELYLSECLERHLKGDWGNVPKSDGKLNDKSVKDGSRVMSSYFIDPSLPLRGDFWIITEADRSVTTFLLPTEY